MKTKQEIIGVTLSTLFGGVLGVLICYYAGKLTHYFMIELPNRHLEPWVVSASTCGLSTSIGITTFLAMIPSAIVGAGGGATLSWYFTARTGEEE